MQKHALCVGCPLEHIGHGFTEIEVGKRYESTRLLLIGEASGESEARESLPFRPHAQSGSLLADAMREVHVERAEVAITNVLRCRPPKDWLEGAPWQYGATQHCITNHLTRVISELQPHAILALGSTAYRALTNPPKGRYGTLEYTHGYVVRGAGCAEGIPVIGTPHPAFLRRGNAHLIPWLQRDLRRAFNVAAGKLVRGKSWGYGVDDFECGGYRVAPTIDEAWSYAENLDPSLPLAFDIETPYSTRSDEDERTSFTDRDIRLFQCTQRRGEGIALPFRDEFVEVVRVICQFQNVGKVGFNNWSFDDPVLRANGVEIDETDDAMVMFGTYWSDLPKNLQPAAQMCGFPFPWKSLGESDLALYGCIDVDATLTVYEWMRKVLSGETVG